MIQEKRYWHEETNILQWGRGQHRTWMSTETIINYTPKDGADPQPEMCKRSLENIIFPEAGYKITPACNTLEQEHNKGTHPQWIPQPQSFDMKTTLPSTKLTLENHTSEFVVSNHSHTYTYRVSLLFKNYYTSVLGFIHRYPRHHVLWGHRLAPPMECQMAVLPLPPSCYILQYFYGELW